MAITSKNSFTSYRQSLLSCRAVATGNIAGIYAPGADGTGIGATLTASSAGVQTIDGVALVKNDSVLLPSQTTVGQNGVYIMTTEGTANVAAVFTRRPDLQSEDQCRPGMHFAISAGTTYGGSIWTLIEPAPSQIGISNMVFTSTEASIPDGSITAAKLASNAVTTVKITDANVTLAKLASGITPSHVVKFAGKFNNGGGSATVTITGLTGVVATDIGFVSVQASTNAVSVQKVTPGTDQIVVLLSADPGASTILSYQVLRAAA